MYPMPNVERHIEVQGDCERNSSQEYIIDGAASAGAGTASDFDEGMGESAGRNMKGAGINKTVEFKVYEVRK